MFYIKGGNEMRQKMITLEFFLPDSNQQDGKFSTFSRALLDPCQKKKVDIISIKPSNGLILIVLKVEPDFLPKLEEIYYEVYQRPFSVNWEG